MGASQTAINPNHPADKAMLAEQTPQPASPDWTQPLTELRHDVVTKESSEDLAKVAEQDLNTFVLAADRMRANDTEQNHRDWLLAQHRAQKSAHASLRADAEAELHHMADLGDGRVEVTLQTGERFIGSPAEVIASLADAQVNTKKWGRGYKQRVAELEAGQQTQVPEATTPAEIARGVESQLASGPPLPDDPRLQAYLVDQFAKGQGFSGAAEYLQTAGQILETSSTMQDQMLAMEFLSRHPEFPATEEANVALTNVMAKANLPYTAENMSLAHAFAVQNGIYRPLSVEEQNASWQAGLAQSNAAESQRPAPPPSIPQASSPDAHTALSWHDMAARMPLDELRSEILRQRG